MITTVTTLGEAHAILSNYNTPNELFVLVPIKYNAVNISLVYKNGQFQKVTTLDTRTEVTFFTSDYLQAVAAGLNVPASIPYAEGTIEVYGCGTFVNGVGAFEFSDFVDDCYRVANYSDRIAVLALWGFVVPSLVLINRGAVPANLELMKNNFKTYAGVCVTKDNQPQIDLFGVPFFLAF